MPTQNPQSRLLISFLELLVGEDSMVRAVGITRLGLAVSILLEDEEMYNQYNKELFGYADEDELPEYRIFHNANGEKIQVRIPLTEIINLYKKFEMNPEAIILLQNKKFKLKYFEQLASRYVDKNAPNIGKTLFAVLGRRTSLPPLNVSPELQAKLTEALQKIKEGKVH